MNLRHARQLYPITHCFHCGNKLGMGEEYTIVRQAFKPPRSYDRWNAIGKACINCEDLKNTYALNEPLPLK